MINAYVLPASPDTQPFWSEQTHQQSEYEFLRSHVRGLLEAISIPFRDGNLWMYLHEEGKLMGLPINRNANRILFALYPEFILGGDFVVGTAVIVGRLNTEGMHQRIDDGIRDTLSRVNRHREKPTAQGGNT